MSKITKALDYINENYLEQISAQDVSNYCGCSTFYLPKLFRNHLGMSYQEYLIYRRIEHAKMLLSTSTRHKIAVVSAESGFLDETYFCRVFKKKVGLTPSQFRINVIQMRARELEAISLQSSQSAKALEGLLLEDE